MTQAQDSRRPFIKMHGLGNDFVVLDARRAPLPLDDERARRIADRRLGVGCDQLLILEPPGNGRAQAFLRIRNNEGFEAGACGNGTRCAAALLMAESGREEVAIETVAGLLLAERAPATTDGLEQVTVDMGRPGLDWAAVPLAREMDTLHLGLSRGPLSDPAAVSMGVPHVTYFVEDAEAVEIETLGPPLEHDALFPERANIGVASPIGADRLRLRVWERGAGLTLACGTGACAAAVNAIRRGLTGRRVALELDGGALTVEWREDGHVMMTGPVATSFEGSFDEALLTGAPA